MEYSTIIIGGGPSGLMAALELEKANQNYLLLEKKEIVAKKLFISGGKRCNVTNNLEVEDFIENLTLRNKKFLYPSLYSFSPSDVVDFFKKNNLNLILENNFKYFPSTDKSQSIIDVLLKNIDAKRIKVDHEVLLISKNEVFEVLTNKGTFNATNVVIATGSKSFPTTGSTGFGLEVANSFNLDYVDFIPAETHIYSVQIKSQYKDLMGTSISNTTVKIVGTKINYTGDLLFTHFGLSGPVIYHLSEFIYEELKKKPVILEFSLINYTELQLLERLSSSNVYILKVLEEFVSKRLAKKILDIYELRNMKITEISKKNLKKITETLCRFRVEVTSVEDRTKAYVNKGGVCLKEINPYSMESKKVKGLYFIGETINIHGPIGGYNITIAFATGKTAALNIIETS